MNLPEMIRQFLTLRVAPASVKFLRSDLRSYFGEVPSVDSLTEGAAATYRDEQAGKVSVVTLRRRFSTLRKFGAYLVELGDIRRNPFDSIELPKSRTRGTVRRDYLRFSEYLKFLAKLPEDGPRQVFTLLGGTGLRIEELMRLRPSHCIIDAEAPFLVVNGKGGKVRKVPLGAAELAALRFFVEHRPPRPGAPVERAVWCRKDSARDAMREALKKSGFGSRAITFHSFRHTFATHYLESGGNALELQKLLGHADLSTTENYLRLAELAFGRARAVIEEMRRVS